MYPLFFNLYRRAPDSALRKVEELNAWVDENIERGFVFDVTTAIDPYNAGLMCLYSEEGYVPEKIVNWSPEILGYLTEDELRAVALHEVGHWVLGHVPGISDEDELKADLFAVDLLGYDLVIHTLEKLTHVISYKDSLKARASELRNMKGST